MSELSALPLRLRRLRDEAGFSQATLARVCGMSPSQISHYEGGSRDPSAANVVRLSKALGISPSELLGARSARVAPEWLSSLSARELKIVEAVAKALVAERLR